MSKINNTRITVLSLFLFLIHGFTAVAQIYTVKADVNLREGPDLNFKVIEKLRHNQTLIEKKLYIFLSM